jgi:hypothetical protein
LTAILNASMTVLTSLTSAATPSNAYNSFHAGLNLTFTAPLRLLKSQHHTSTPLV